MDLPLAGPYGWGDPTGTRTATYSTSAVGAPLALSVSPVQEGRTCDAVPPLTPAIKPCHLTCLFLPTSTSPTGTSVFARNDYYVTECAQQPQSLHCVRGCVDLAK